MLLGLAAAGGHAIAASTTAPSPQLGRAVVESAGLVQADGTKCKACPDPPSVQRLGTGLYEVS